MAEQNANVLEEKRIEFRIEVNLGDIIIDSGDIFGNGVIVAVAWRELPIRAASARRSALRNVHKTNWRFVRGCWRTSTQKHRPAGASGLHSTAACISTIKVLVPLRRPEDFARWAEGLRGRVTGVIDSASGVKSGAGGPRSSHSRQLRSIQYDDVHSISHNQCIQFAYRLNLAVK
jgi:hypothetical protein